MKFSMSDEKILEKVNGILKKMSLAEKIGQLIYIDGNCADDLDLIESAYIGTVANVFGAKKATELQRRALASSPNKIPLLLISDVIQGFRTIFPIPLAESGSFDEDLMKRTAAASAKEAAASGTSWIAGPMVDVSRDARWGRIAESGGEDCYLNCVMGKAKVEGIGSVDRVISCAKHFVAYGSANAGRDYATSLISESELRNQYLPPFKACIDAGAQSIMVSFNDTLGVPMTANKYLLCDVLRNEMGFEGWIVTDYNAIAELITHGVAENETEACKKAVDAGVELDMASKVFLKHLENLVLRGEIPMEFIDNAARRVLYIKYAIGLFDNPFYDEENEREAILCKEHRALAYEAAKKSAVLLKNDGVLPIDYNKKILVTGPLADDPDAPLGWWRCQGQAGDVTTILSALKERGADVQYIKGCETLGDSPIDKSAFENIDCDAIVAVVGEPAYFSGESHSRGDITLPGRQGEFIELLKTLGKPIITVLICGRPLAVAKESGASNALLCAWQYGIAGEAVADILLGNVNPSAKLSVSFPMSAGQLPICYASKNTGRPYLGEPFEMSRSVTSFAQDYTSHYIDMPNSPLYPFGYGLSYSEFEYSDVLCERKKYAAGEPVVVSVKVKNKSEYEGDEIVQLYIGDVSAQIARPVKELKAFKKIHLRAGEEREVTFEILPESFGYVAPDNKFIIEKGGFKIWIAKDSQSGNPIELELI
jgi:beta-glucosidase